MRVKPKTIHILPKDWYFTIELYGNETFTMFGISISHFTLWFSYGWLYGKKKSFEVGLSNYNTHDFIKFFNL